MESVPCCHSKTIHYSLCTIHISRSGTGGLHWSRDRARRRRWTWRYMAIVTVALDRLAASFANGVLECRHTLFLRSSRPGHVKDLLLQDCAVQIVHALAEPH